jgi:predicted nucleic acid-binding protein
MIAYLDSSVLLRLVLGRPDSLAEWADVEVGVTSALTQVECLRTLDRLRIAQPLRDGELAPRREAIYRLMEAMSVVEVSASVLARASQPMPTTLGTLDALHLSTALLWAERSGSEIVMATHDSALATAACASGMRVVGHRR